MPWYLYLIILLILATLGRASLSLAPWVPTRRKDLGRICDLANFEPGDKFYDLGCGDGRLVVYAGRHYEVKATGIELALPFYFLCQLRRWFFEKENIEFKFNNLFFIDLSDADVVYLFPQTEKKLSGKLITKLEKGLKTGARVITYVFPVNSWEPAMVSKPTDKDLPIYLYVR